MNLFSLPHFHSPWVLWLLLLVPLLAWDAVRREGKRRASIRFPSTAGLGRLPQTFSQKLRPLLVVLRLVAVSLLIVALARPQSSESLEEINSLGIDIALVLDVSTSMKTLDFKPKNRLNVAKQVLEDFVKGRKHDRISLVVFSGRSYTQCPPTLDYDVLIQLLRQVDFGRVEDGTAIGTAILNGTNRLRGTGSKSKVMILLTDGANNAGEVSPVTAARAAKALGIKIYTVAVGKDGDQPVEVDDPVFGKRIVMVPTQIDEPMLREIASLTGGKYFRAQNPKALSAIYASIDKLERTEIKTSSHTRYGELFMKLAWAALALLLLEVLLAQTRFRKAP
jgi:Ca-activated chloride channel family protein